MASQAPAGTEPGTEANATDPDAPAPGAPPAGNEPEPGSGDEGGDETPAAIVELAQEMGWTPRDKYAGPPENWKDARTFIRDGREIQRDTSRELKTVRATLDTLARTTGSIVEQQVNERLNNLTAQHAELVEAGDTEGALRVAEQITRTKATPTTPTGITPEAQDFAARNQAWFNQPGKEWATSEAVGICNELAAQGYDQPTQLRICEQRMQHRYPQLFGKANGTAPGKPPPGMNAPRNSAPGNRSGPKTFADLPKAAQDIALDLERRLKVPKEKYAENYFANEAGKA